MTLLKFLLVGIANTALGLVVIWGLMFAFRMDVVTSNLIGYAAGLIFSFFANRSWTFGDGAPASRSFPRWLLTAAVAYPANLATVVLATRWQGLNPYFAQAIGVIAYSTIMFLGSRYFVFRCSEQPRGGLDEPEASTSPEHCRSVLQ